MFDFFWLKGAAPASAPGWPLPVPAVRLTADSINIFSALGPETDNQPPVPVKKSL